LYEYITAIFIKKLDVPRMGEKFANELINWYHQNKRNLPWRNTSDPYRIWLSEIILQQTQVVQGLKYYNKFIEKFPSIELLSESDEQEVLSLWQGLGYYSRARNLHFTAKFVTNELDGKMPNNYAELLKLKGVGHYTAAAIASFCFDEPVAVLDGNVYRVLSRFFGVESPINSTEGIKKFKILSQEKLSLKDPATYNQAIMEFGALQCRHANPLCSECPISSKCYAFLFQKQDSLPVKLKKTKVKKIQIDFYIIQHEGKLAISQRTSNSIWKNLWEFPSIHSDAENEFEIADLTIIKSSAQIKHILSHRHIMAQFHLCIAVTRPQLKDTKWISQEEIQDFPIHRLMDKFLESHPNFIE